MTRRFRPLRFRPLLGLFLFFAVVGIAPTFVAEPSAAELTAEPAFDSDARAAAEPFERAFVSFRISGGVWEDEARFDELLALFDKYPGAVDEITLFTETTHTPPPVEVFERRLAVIKERIAAAKKRGYRAGINILCTVGHHPEGLPQGIGPEYPRCVTLDGRVAQGTLCPSSPEFRERLRRIYTAMATSGADYVWIDDDVRCGHWTDSAGNGGSVCFCDACLRRMSEKWGEETTRENLAPRAGDPEVAAKIRAFRADVIDGLFAEIESIVHTAKPGLPLGFMTGERFDEGYAFARWAKTLAGPDGAPVYWRPGGGFYAQDGIGGLNEKSRQIARQIARLSPDVRVVESEIENFTYAPLQKSRRIAALEAASHIGAGCTGAAFNVLTMNRGESLADYEPLIAELARWRPFYDAAVRAFGRRPLGGVYASWSAEENDNSLDGRLGSLVEIGIPLTFADETGTAPVVVASPETLRRISAADGADENKARTGTKSLLSRGVFTDVWGVCALNDPAGSDAVRWTGIEWDGDRPIDSIEVYSDDPLNGEFAGVERDQRQSFWRETAYNLKLSDPKTRALARLIDYSGETTAPASAAAFENELGGRIAVAGYYPWSHYFSRGKATQVKRLARWLSKDRLCAWVDSFERANLWARVDDAGNAVALLLINSTYDAAERPIVALRTTAERVKVVDRTGAETLVDALDADGPYRRFALPALDAWDAALIVVETTEK